MFQTLLQDESGFVISTELMLVATLLVIGMIVGMVTLRDNVVTELADVADAISAMDQSHQTSDITGHSASSAGFIFDDNADFCDGADGGVQGLGGLAGLNTCVLIDEGDTAEGTQDPNSPTNGG